MKTQDAAERNIASAIVAMLLAAVASVCVSGAVAYAALETIPCSWFSSSFEGGCGYSAVMAAILGAALLSLVLFFVFMALYVKRRKDKAGPA